MGVALMPPEPSSPEFTITSTIAELVQLRPELARLLAVAAIDPRQDGGLTLSEFCARRGLDAATTLFWLNHAGDALVRPPERAVETMTLTQLVDHIESTHHAYVKKELPGLLEMAHAVATLHGERDPRWLEVNAIIQNLAQEFREHMEEEEAGLFPFIRRVEAGTANYVDGRMLDDTIGQMEAEHAETTQAVARLRGLTEGFAVGQGGCDMQCALLAALTAFEADLALHVHKENDLLFPRTFAHAAL